MCVIWASWPAFPSSWKVMKGPISSEKERDRLSCDGNETEGMVKTCRRWRRRMLWNMRHLFFAVFDMPVRRVWWGKCDGVSSGECGVVKVKNG